jgi:hypothetical protein
MDGANKRPADGAANGEDAKRAKLAPPPSGGPPPATAPAKPGLSLEALEKAKRALQLQKELKEKMAKVPMGARMTAWFTFLPRSDMRTA